MLLCATDYPEDYKLSLVSTTVCRKFGTSGTALEGNKGSTEGTGYLQKKLNERFPTLGRLSKLNMLNRSQ